MNEVIERVERLGPALYRITAASPHVAGTSLPGQFLTVACGDRSHLLRRPISLCRVDRKKGTFDLVFRIRGAGTEGLADQKPGERLDFIGPSGRPFDLSPGYGRIAVVGGGIGIFPLLFLLQESGAGEKSAYLGFRSSEEAVLLDDFARAAGDRLEIATEDGSRGAEGLVTVPFEKALSQKRFDIVYTCGPAPMMKRVSELCGERGIPCQVSLEQRMGCGIGACLVCACKLKTGAEDGGFRYGHVCSDGPVFRSDEVYWK